MRGENNKGREEGRREGVGGERGIMPYKDGHNVILCRHAGRLWILSLLFACTRVLNNSIELQICTVHKTKMNKVIQQFTLIGMAR